MKLLDIRNGNIDEIAKEAARALASGKLIVYPTDTFYNIGVDATNAKAVEIFKAVKGWKSNRPYFSIFSSLESVEQYAELTEDARILIKRFLPGPLALIVPAKPDAPSSMVFNGFISVRMPQHPFFEAMSKATSVPFLTTNANKRGRELTRKMSDILAQFTHDGRHIGLMIEDAERYSDLPLTIVSFRTGVPVMEREGTLTKDELGLI